MSQKTNRLIVIKFKFFDLFKHFLPIISISQEILLSQYDLSLQNCWKMFFTFAGTEEMIPKGLKNEKTNFKMFLFALSRD